MSVSQPPLLDRFGNVSPLIVDTSLVDRFELPSVVEPVYGCLFCPVGTCSYASYRADKLDRHIWLHHVPRDPGSFDLGEFDTPAVDARSVLERVNFSVDLERSLVLCREPGCRHAVDPRDMRIHVGDHGRYLSAIEIRRIAEEFDPMGIVEFSQTVGDTLCPVPGIPLCPRAYFCMEMGCMTSILSFKLLGEHCRLSHGGQFTRFFAVGPYQTVFGHRGPSFRVSREDVGGLELEPEGSDSDGFSSFKSCHVGRVRMHGTGLLLGMASLSFTDEMFQVEESSMNDHTRMPTLLPVETLHAICTATPLSRGELANVASASHTLAAIARPLLYRTLTIQLGGQTSTKDTLSLLCADRRLAETVTALSVAGFWKDDDDREQLLDGLFSAMENLVSLKEVEMFGGIFENCEEQAHFFESLARCCRLETLKLGFEVEDCASPALSSFRLSQLVVKPWMTPFPGHMVRQLLEGSRLHLVHLTLPFWYNRELPLPFWLMEFPKLKTISIPTDNSQHESLLPPDNEVAEFLWKHAATLEYVEFTGFLKVIKHASEVVSCCRLKLVPFEGTDDYGTYNHRFLVREMDTRLEVACRVAIQHPWFLTKGLERLTLEYSNDNLLSDGLVLLLFRLFKFTLKPFDFECQRLHTLICRFDHPHHADQPQSERHVQKVFAALRDVAALCGPRLRHLSGILPPTRIPSEVVASELSKFTNLQRLGIYEATTGTADRGEVKEYVLRLKRVCPRLAAVEVFGTDLKGTPRCATPAYEVDVLRETLNQY